MRCYNKNYSYSMIVDLAGTSASTGTTMQGMVGAANQIGLPAKAIKTNVNGLIKDDRIPILVLNLEKSGHYVILDSINKNHVRLLDGSIFINLSVDELTDVWGGYAIMIGSDKRHILAKYQHSIGLCIISFGILMLLVIALKKRVTSHSSAMFFRADRVRYKNS